MHQRASHPQAFGSAATSAAAPAAAAAALPFPPAPAAPQEEEEGEEAAAGASFLSAVDQIAGLSSAAQLRVHAERWRAEEGHVRTPLVLLQLLALARQFACMRRPPATPAERKTYGIGLKKHGQSTPRMLSRDAGA